MDEVLERAASALRDAEALIIGAGAGMSVDAGIPAYRLNPATGTGPETQRDAPPALGALVPMLFTVSPPIAWGRAGRQLMLFRGAAPHAGYPILRCWSERRPHGAFVLSSNVDGLFLAAGFGEQQVLEGHGSLHHLQCSTPCSGKVWSAAAYTPRFDPQTEAALPPLPRCPDCGAPARPNVFMFGDSHFATTRTDEQIRSFERWLSGVRGRRVAVVECGAGTAVPTIRRRCQALAAELGATLIRINLAEPDADAGILSIPLPALVALQQLDAALGA